MYIFKNPNFSNSLAIIFFLLSGVPVIIYFLPLKFFNNILKKSGL